VTARTPPDGARSAPRPPAATGAGDGIPDGAGTAEALSEPAWCAPARDRIDEANRAWRDAVGRVADLAERLNVDWYDHDEHRWRSFAWLITEGGGLT